MIYFCQFRPALLSVINKIEYSLEIHADVEDTSDKMRQWTSAFALW